MPIGSHFFSFWLILVLPGVEGETYFQSEALRGLQLQPHAGTYFILDDNGEEIEVQRMEDKDGILYWYRRIFTPVCLTGECKMVDVGLYWYCTGEFLGIDVYREHLTKTDHSIFKEEDYDKLLSVLGNDWSSLREYEFSDLVEEPAEGVDGTSGATKKEIAEQSVEDAVYTTYTLWHLIHVGEKEQLAGRTAEVLNKEDIIQTLLQARDNRYRHFLLDMFALGKLNESMSLISLIVEGLKSQDDPALKGLAFRSLSRLDVNNSLLQAELAELYPQAEMNEKLQILSALKGADIRDKDLYQALGRDLVIDNEWFLIRLLDVLKQAPVPTQEVLAAANRLMNSDNPMVKKAVMEFIGR